MATSFTITQVTTQPLITPAMKDTIWIQLQSRDVLLRNAGKASLLDAVSTLLQCEARVGLIVDPSCGGGGGGQPYLGFTATCCHIILRVMIHRYRVCNLASIKSFFLSLRTKLFWTLAICALFNSQFRPLCLYMHVLEPSWSRFWEKIILSWRMLTRPIGVG